MTPEADLFLEKAQKHLERASTMLGVGLNEDAGRSAYLAGFHAAYETGPGSEISAERAASAIEVGKKFVTYIADLMRSLQWKNY